MRKERKQTRAWLYLALASLAPMMLDASRASAAFVHPGGLHTRRDLDRMKAKVAAREHPWIDGWDVLITDPKAQNTWKSSPKPNMGVSRQRAQNDACAAYLNALRWSISGDTSYAECAVRNLNSWSAVVNQVPHGVDQPGLGGIPIGTFALAAEVLRTYPGWSAEDQARFKTMLVQYFYPAVDAFLAHRSNPTHHWANWDAANILSLLAIGVYCDDRAKFEQGVEYYKNGVGMGSIMHAVPFLYPGGLGQWQESGRDHAHAFGGMGLLAEACQVAWNQGVDLFGYANDRLLAGANYEARYAQWIGVPYTFYTNADKANQYYISANYRGRLSNCEFYELLYNHYAMRRGKSVPDVQRFAELLRPEGGNVDLCGYGTLTYTLDAAASPCPASPVPPVPRDLVAQASAGRVFLKWSPSGAYTTRGYVISRSTQRDGVYTTIFSTTGNTTPQYIDAKVENGKTYYYAVAANNQSGTSAPSEPASATPMPLGALPAGWAAAEIGVGDGHAGYAAVSGDTFTIAGNGAGIGGAADACYFIHHSASDDFTITTRLTDKSGPVRKVGLMMRQSLEPGAPTVAMTVGEIGGRQARFGTRAEAGGRWTSQSGNDYTWPPVWLRLQRVGNTFTASQSPDGSMWFTVGKREVAMAKTYLVGFAISSAKPAGDQAQAEFDHVSLAVAPPEQPSTPSNLIARDSAEGITLEWTNTAAGQEGIRVECSTDNAIFHEIASLDGAAHRFVNTGVKGRLFYRVRACNTGGFSTYSNTADAQPVAGNTAPPDSVDGRLGI